MFSSKFPILPIIGLISLASVLGFSYVNGGLFMEHLLPSSFILSSVFLVKILGKMR